MKKDHAIKRAGTITELARILGVKTQAISQWKADVPKMRVYQLQVLRPEWFTGRRNV